VAFDSETFQSGMKDR
nr:periplasmic protein 5 {internal} [Rhodobacter sphaeroides, forma sp. denitrificans, Peptide Partial, 15 aa] [Cereibacter sphaeroides]